MAWNDGVTKELHDYLESVGNMAGKSKEVIKQQVDIEAEALREQLARTTPRRYGDLVRSLSKVEVTNRHNWYGWRIEFVGNNKNGVPFQKIANILNFGSSTIKGKRFISKAIRILRGMDDRIAKRFEQEVDKAVD